MNERDKRKLCDALGERTGLKVFAILAEMKPCAPPSVDPAKKKEK